METNASLSLLSFSQVPKVKSEPRGWRLVGRHLAEQAARSSLGAHCCCWRLGSAWIYPLDHCSRLNRSSSTRFASAPLSSVSWRPGIGRKQTREGSSSLAILGDPLPHNWSPSFSGAQINPAGELIEVEPMRTPVSGNTKCISKRGQRPIARARNRVRRRASQQ